MKMLTLHQPWASLIAVGAKTIETRPWSTDYRGPLAIHAAKKNDDMATFWLDEELHRLGLGCFTDDRWTHPPLGAVVAVCDLVDVVPIERIEWCAEPDYDKADSWVRVETDDISASVRADQLPFGDFTPGRYAWLLDNVRAVDPIPCKGFQGLRDCPVEVP